MRRRIGLLLLLVMCLPSNEAVAQAAAATELAGILVVLQQLKSELDSAINTVDQETAARIRQVEIALDGTIAKVKNAMDHGYSLLNNSRDQLMGNIATLMIQTQDMFQDSASTVLLGANDTLANLAGIVTAIPGVDVPTYIYAVTPLRFQPNSNDSHVEIHGFFPDVSNSHPATVHFEGGKTLVLDSYVNHTLAFDMPPGTLAREDSFVTMGFDLPVKHLLGTYYSLISIKARIYVESAAPFSMKISVKTGNPAQWATVKATTPLIERADSDRTTFNETFTAAQVFSTLVNDNVHYDMSSAEFVGFNLLSVDLPDITGLSNLPFFGHIMPTHIDLGSLNPIHDGENPCAEGCTSSTGSWSWDATNLRIALSAPNCKVHFIKPSGFFEAPYQCGGGTHADFNAVPTFRVKTRDPNITPEVAVLQKRLDLAHNRVSEPISLPGNWTSIDIIGAYKDGKKSRQTFVRLTSGDTGIHSANEPIFWKAEIAGQSLIISTR